MVVTGEDEESFIAKREAIRTQLAFYASTPAYAGVMELHGWHEARRELTRLSKAGRWQDMATLIDATMLNELAVVCEQPEDVPAQLKARYGDLMDAWMCTVNLRDPERQRALLAALRQP